MRAGLRQNVESGRQWATVARSRASFVRSVSRGSRQLRSAAEKHATTRVRGSARLEEAPREGKARFAAQAAARRSKVRRGRAGHHARARARFMTRETVEEGRARKPKTNPHFFDDLSTHELARRAKGRATEAGASIARRIARRTAIWTLSFECTRESQLNRILSPCRSPAAARRPPPRDLRPPPSRPTRCCCPRTTRPRTCR